MNEPKVVEDTTTPRWRWYRSEGKSTYHQFVEFDTSKRSRCGVAAYPIQGNMKSDPTSWERCRSCDKMSRGLAGNAKTY